MLQLLLLALILLHGCIAYTDVDVETNINVNVMIEADANATFSVEVCQDLQLTSPEPEPPEDPDSGLLGKWDDCESHDQCETGLCFCYLCVDISDFLN